MNDESRISNDEIQTQTISKTFDQLQLNQSDVPHKEESESTQYARREDNFELRNNEESLFLARPLSLEKINTQGTLPVRTSALGIMLQPTRNTIKNEFIDGGTTNYTFQNRDFITNRLRKNSIKAHEFGDRKSRYHHRSKSVNSSISYSSCPQSPAVEFLSGMAEMKNTSFSFQKGEIVEGYVIGEVIGTGAFSEVREAFTQLPADDKDSNMSVVQKADETSMNIFEKEINIWKTLDHPNILPLIEILVTEETKIAVSPAAAKGNFLQFLMKNGALSDDNVLKDVIYQLTDAILYLHEDANVAHRDIKLENILVDFDYHIWLCDFGLSESLALCSSEKICLASGSLAYSPPEEVSLSSHRLSIDGNVFDRLKASDVWSLGVVFYALATGNLPFSDSFPPRLQLSIISGKYKPFPESFQNSSLKELISSILTTDYRKRPTISQVKKLPYFNAQ
ncbi:kinase-like protein [Rozella allomycis CSF55]|uniref:Kinase-like protein n=1 Tax=Rozella allomycis (strain CSF55) TaxID=988480 RepID=A0A4V1J0I6_ROZAC|nr:kinase-like protein [Rozella allomycis CSF55]